MKEVAKTAAASAVGAAVGAGMHSAIGGIGVAATGTALGITLGPFIAIGAGLGAAGYVVYWFGKKVGKKEKDK